MKNMKHYTQSIKPLSSVLFFMLMALLAKCQGTDLLNGNGVLNSTKQLSNWKIINNTAYSFSIINNNTVNGHLKIEKKNTSSGSYDDGIFYFFGDKQPNHISLQMRTDSADIESCDLRLTSINSTTSTLFHKLDWQDVAFFRFGYFNYQKLNLVSMVQKFTNDTWYQIDLLVDWDDDSVTVYVDKQQKASDYFFTNKKTSITSANTIVLYNLTPGSSCFVKNLQICEGRCKGGEEYYYAFGVMLQNIQMSLIVLLAVTIYSLI